MKLNLGAGAVPLEGYENLDRKTGQEIYPLAYPDDSADEIRASHVLEHFSHRLTGAVLAEWYRVLKPGGWLKLAVPDFEWIARGYLDHKEIPVQAYTMGGHVDQDDVHLAAFDREALSQAMRAVGLVDLCGWKSEAQDCASLPVSLNLAGRKLPPLPQIKVAGVFSTPRLMFSDFSDCALGALLPLNIPSVRTGGAYWGQCLERAMTKKAAEGADWLLTFDYDSIFTTDHVTALLRLAAEHDEADAIAPLEMARGRDGSKPLLVIRDAKGHIQTKIASASLNEPLTKVQTAHFGLTLIRVAALKEIPHPWFHSAPNDSGEWEEGRVDDDIFFWHKWEQYGKSLYIANRVAIGHAELMVTWPDREFNAVHQYPTDFHENGIPECVWR